MNTSFCLYQLYQLQYCVKACSFLLLILLGLYLKCAKSHIIILFLSEPRIVLSPGRDGRDAADSGECEDTSKFCGLIRWAGGDTWGQKQNVALNEFAQKLKRVFTSIDIRLKCNLFGCTFFGVECLIDKFLGNFLGNVHAKFSEVIFGSAYMYSAETSVIS